MFTAKRYSVFNLALWTRKETFVFFLVSLIPTILYHEFGLEWLHLPWTPLALIGTALAFMIGFQNNAAYGRIWEARKIWGGIVNTSRTWTMKVRDMVSNEYTTEPVTEEELRSHIVKLVHRHVAWLVALRHNMRQTRKWEVVAEHKTNREWQESTVIPEYLYNMEDELRPYLDDEELEDILNKRNSHGAILMLQSAHIRELKERGLIWEFAFLELENVLEEFFTLQGKSERIKNFPYPRQYASLGYYFVWVFVFLLPFGIVPEFEEIGRNLKPDFPMIGAHFLWLAIPFCMIVSWIFHTMERIGRVGENPFEGSPNDVPISNIARGIEIDIRQFINDNPDNIPTQFPEKRNVQM